MDGSGRKEKGNSRRRYDDDEAWSSYHSTRYDYDEARSSYHSTRYDYDETKVKRREDEQMDRNDRWDREREDKPRMDKRGRRDLDGEEIERSGGMIEVERERRQKR